MGSSKKRKEKAKDFSKAKLKLGTGKKTAPKATNASFTSKTVGLGQQSIGREHKDEPVTKRNLTLADLHTQLKHYSVNTRKDALSGLHELLTANSQLILSSTSTLLPALARMIGDEEAAARKALLSFLAWYLPRVPSIVLQPHHSVLVFFTTSALSHIFPEIRLDGVRMLNLLLDNIAGGIVLNWSTEETASKEVAHGQRLLEGYLALLHIRSGVATNGLRTDMSSSSKAIILASLSRFLQLSLAPDGSHSVAKQDERAIPSVPTWHLAGSLRSRRAFTAFRQLCDGHKAKRREDWIIDEEGTASDVDGLAVSCDDCVSDVDSTFMLAELSVADLLENDAQHGETSTNTLPHTPSALLSVLAPVLIAAFLDSAPTAFTPAASAPSTSTSSPTEAALDTVIAVADIARNLYRAILLAQAVGSDGCGLVGAAKQSLEKLVSHMATYFPYGADQVTTLSTSDEKKMQSLNFAYCELIALLVLHRQDEARTQKMASRNSKLDAQLSIVERYITQLLSIQSSSGLVPSSQSLSAHGYVQLLPTIWALLSSAGERHLTGEQVQSAIWPSLLEHYLSLSAASGTKKVAVQAISQFVQLQNRPDYIGSFALKKQIQTAEASAAFDQWCLSLPRYLWELGNKDSATSAIIIAQMKHLTLAGLLSEDISDQFCSFLAAFFFSNHPQRGEIAGPWTKLAHLDLQKGALELAWWMQSLNVPPETLRLAVDQAVAHLDDINLRLHWQRLNAII